MKAKVRNAEVADEMYGRARKMSCEDEVKLERWHVRWINEQLELDVS